MNLGIIETIIVCFWAVIVGAVKLYLLCGHCEASKKELMS